MESKKEKAIRLLKTNNGFLTCPVCGEYLSVSTDLALRCINGHSFDISRKGTINLAGGSNDRIYNDILFKNRRQILKSGYYDKLTEALASIISQRRASEQNEIDILDAGCGEGSFLNGICSCFSNKHIKGLRVGIDLSRSGINMATDNENDILWIIDDLADLHMADGTFDVVIDILSPANHDEFKRVLSEDGFIIKVIPGRNYLSELREIIIPDPENNFYDNSDTIRHTEKWMEIEGRKKLEYTVSADEEDLSAFAKMTPMTHGKILPREIKKACGLTIDLEILIGKPI